MEVEALRMPVGVLADVHVDAHADAQVNESECEEENAHVELGVLVDEH